MPVWQTESDFSGDETTVGRARAFCTERLQRLMGPGDAAIDLISTSELVVSELVTNAVRAQSSRISVRLTVDDYNLVIAVRDDGTGQPAPRTAAPTDTNGRGLALVSALSNAWGFSGPEADASKPPAKTVWAQFCLTPKLLELAFADHDGSQDDNPAGKQDGGPGNEHGGEHVADDCVGLDTH
jgi:anti-sigma regulatory factor (Ser/Thr protein kinase)